MRDILVLTSLSAFDCCRVNTDREKRREDKGLQNFCRHERATSPSMKRHAPFRYWGQSDNVSGLQPIKPTAVEDQPDPDLPSPDPKLMTNSVGRSQGMENLSNQQINSLEISHPSSSYHSTNSWQSWRTSSEGKLHVMQKFMRQDQQVPTDQGLVFQSFKEDAIDTDFNVPVRTKTRQSRTQAQIQDSDINSEASESAQQENTDRESGFGNIGTQTDNGQGSQTPESSSSLSPNGHDTNGNIPYCTLSSPTRIKFNVYGIFLEMVAADLKHLNLVAKQELDMNELTHIGIRNAIYMGMDFNRISQNWPEDLQTLHGINTTEFPNINNWNCPRS